MIKIRPEMPLLNSSFQILICSSYETNVNADLLDPAQAVVGNAIQNAEQLYLHPKVKVPDFIEEQRAVICELKQARLGTIGIAEGAFFVPEQLAFQEILRQSRAVDILRLV